MKNHGDMSGLVSQATELACDMLDNHVEVDGFAGPGGPSYSEDDLAGIDAQREELSHLNFLLAGPGCRAFILNEEQVAVIAGMIAPSSDDVNRDGIYSNEWDTLREMFPITSFREWASQNVIEEDGCGYNEDAGF